VAAACECQVTRGVPRRPRRALLATGSEEVYDGVRPVGRLALPTSTFVWIPYAAADARKPSEAPATERAPKTLERAARTPPAAHLHACPRRVPESARRRVVRRRQRAARRQRGRAGQRSVELDFSIQPRPWLRCGRQLRQPQLVTVWGCVLSCVTNV
jgi:hypothetical protein